MRAQNYFQQIKDLCRNRRPFEELVGNGLFEPPLILKKFNQNQATMESLFIEGFLWILIS